MGFDLHKNEIRVMPVETDNFILHTSGINIFWNVYLSFDDKYLKIAIIGIKRKTADITLYNILEIENVSREVSGAIYDILEDHNKLISYFVLLKNGKHFDHYFHNPLTKNNDIFTFALVE